MLLHEVLNKAKCLYPEYIAVESNKNSITFQCLDRISTKLALNLLIHGIQKEDRVAILLNKSIEMVAVFLGTLKSGACYIPMDTSAPDERISYIIRDAKVRFIVTDRTHMEQALTVRNEKTGIVLLDEDDGQNDEQEVYSLNLYARDEGVKDCLPHIDIHENDLAYILYTSGSTGEPKGVSLSHKNAVCFVDWACKYFEVSNQDVLSSHAPFYFDLSVFDIYVSIKAGARLCLLPPAVSAFPASLAQYIEDRGITIWYSVPSVLVKLLHYGKLDTQKFENLRKIIYAGEAFPVGMLKELMHTLPNADFYNLYGPTETNVITYYPVKASDCDSEIPIGYACPYANLWVVKEDGNIAEIGEKGELIVQSDSLMREYINKEQLTKKVIKEISTDKLPQGEYYFTGDIVKIIEEGLYQFVCRKDHMIKIKGFRVELEEIETVLRKSSLIKECVVQYVDNEKTDPFLRAYIIGEGEAKEIVQFAKKYLPEYMIPYDIKYVPEFEYTERGKINRKMVCNSTEQRKRNETME